MAEELNNNNSNPGNGRQDRQDKQPENKTFTQTELEAIITDRLKRERDKYKDYADLKKAAEELQRLRESQMSETEKLSAKLAEYERKLLEKEQEAAEAKIEMLKYRLLEDEQLPKHWADRIRGATEEEIRSEIKELKKLLGVSNKPVGGATNPAAASSTGASAMNNFISRNWSGNYAKPEPSPTHTAGYIFTWTVPTIRPGASETLSTS